MTAIIVDKKEEEEKTVSVRRHGQGDLGKVKVEDLAERLKREVDSGA